MPIIRSSRLIRSPLAVAAIAITFLITAALQAQLSVSPPRISPGGVLKLTSRALAKQDPGLRFVMRSTGGRPVQVELEIEKWIGKEVYARVPKNLPEGLGEFEVVVLNRDGKVLDVAQAPVRLTSASRLADKPPVRATQKVPREQDPLDTVNLAVPRSLSPQQKMREYVRQQNFRGEPRGLVEPKGLDSFVVLTPKVPFVVDKAWLFAEHPLEWMTHLPGTPTGYIWLRNEAPIPPPYIDVNILVVRPDCPHLLTFYLFSRADEPGIDVYVGHYVGHLGQDSGQYRIVGKQTILFAFIPEERGLHTIRLGLELFSNPYGLIFYKVEIDVVE